MKRVEIIGNQELLADIEEQLQNKLPRQHYTILNVLTGKGRKGEARGDGVWPTRNFYCVLFVDSDETVSIIQKIIKIRKHDNEVNALVSFISDGQTIKLQDYVPQVTIQPETISQDDVLRHPSEEKAHSSSDEQNM